MKFKHFVNEEKKVVVCKLDNEGTGYTKMSVGIGYIRNILKKQPMPTCLKDIIDDLLCDNSLYKIKDALPRDEQLVGIARCGE
jgi:hypothetical protein